MHHTVFKMTAMHICKKYIISPYVHSEGDVFKMSCGCFKVALGVSPQFFSILIRVLNHNKYVEIKQFSKEDIKQNNISTVILLIKFLVYQ